MSAIRFFFQLSLIALITLAGLELALRVYASFPREADRFIHDENIGFRQRSDVPVRNDQTTNRGGFNDREHAAEPIEGATRLAIIGDSFVFGAVARDYNFTFVLEDLAQQNGVDLDVINMGISAAGPKNYLGLLAHDVAESQADLVAVTLFVGNDITQAHPHFKTSVWLNRTRETLVKPYLIGPSWEYSYVYRSVRSVARTLRERLDKTPRASFTRKNFMAIERQRSPIYKKDMSTFVSDSYAGVIQLTREMSKEAERQDRELIVILAPDELQVSSEIQDHLAKHYLLDLSEYDLEQPQSLLIEALTSQGIRVIDLLPHFQQAKDSGDLYIQYDTHWNEAGNRLAAEAIWQFLKDESLF